MVEIGPYLLMGVIGIFSLALIIFVGYMVYISREEKKALQSEKEAPRADTLAEKIKEQFKVEEVREDRVIRTKSGIAKTSLKQTRSAFSFKDEDAESGISLESDFDNGLQDFSLTPEEKK